MRLNYINQYYYTKNEIVCIMSSNEYEESNAYYLGSPFTKALLNNLQLNHKTWLNLLNQTQKDVDKFILLASKQHGITDNYIKQTVNIYSSLIIDKYLWYWITMPTKLRVKWSYQNNYLIIYKK